VVVRDEQWPVARLIPISSASGVEAQERGVASALLAVIAAVPEFGRALLNPLGAPAHRDVHRGAVPSGRQALRPDGVITVTRAGKRWGVLVEAKTSSNPFVPEQVNNYLDLAREADQLPARHGRGRRDRAMGGTGVVGVEAVAALNQPGLITRRPKATDAAACR
jgi:hypothetical protein